MRELAFIFFFFAAWNVPVPQGLLRPQLQAVQHLLVLPGRTGDHTEHRDSQIEFKKTPYFPLQDGLDSKTGLRKPDAGFCVEPNQCICSAEAKARDTNKVCNEECINGT